MGEGRKRRRRIEAKQTKTTHLWTLLDLFLFLRPKVLSSTVFYVFGLMVADWKREKKQG